MDARVATSQEILQHTTEFLTEILSQSDHRKSVYSILRRKIPQTDQTTLKSLNLVVSTLENAISSEETSGRSSSLLLAEKRLLSYPETSFSSFLLSLIYTLFYRHVDASLRLLDLFSSSPSLARSEIAPNVFEYLFLVRLFPVIQWFNDQRAEILSSVHTNSMYDCSSRSGFDESVVLTCSNSLSRMSGGQAVKLKELERDYEEVVDENCRVLVVYLKEVLGNKDEKRFVKSPSLIMRKLGQKLGNYGDGQIKEEEFGLKNIRYNPIWSEGDISIEPYNSSSGSNKSMSPFFPENPSTKPLTTRKSPRRLKTSPVLNLGSGFDSTSDDNSTDSSSLESEPEIEEKNITMELPDPRQSQTQKQKQPMPSESSGFPYRAMADYDNSSGGGKHTPPKDFVCPITSHLFDDPVTLETGQTYERRAIQEWLDRGNSTCPITRQSLHNTELPKTNYVLKRLIASWQEQNPYLLTVQSDNPSPETEPVFISKMPSTSPNSVISQATIDGTVSELRQAISNLCTSEILKESEMAVLRIQRFWQEGNKEVEIQTLLSKPPVINGFVEILLNSVDLQVLKAAIFLLCELGSRDNGVIQTLTQVDSDMEGIVSLFNKGLTEAVVLIHLLKPTMRLIEMEMIDSLLATIKKNQEELLEMYLNPKTASVLLLAQILGSSEESSVSSIARTIVAVKVVEDIVGSLEAELPEERIAAVKILLRCLWEEGKCRNIIADKAELAPVLESFIGASDINRFEIVQFLAELVKLNRRTFNEQVLHIIKDEGSFSTMHTLLTYLQTALPEQCPVVAGLLLQLDLLMEPRNMSIYREEAIDALISCLRNSDFPASQIAAAETIVLLQGRFTYSGKPLTRAFLLKRAGLAKSYKTLMRVEQLNKGSGEIDETLDEEKAAEKWERKMAFVLVSHEFGVLFEALAEGLKSKYAELCTSCFVSSTWLVHMLTVLPDTGILGAARVCLLKRFISIFKSARDIEDRALAMLSLRSFIQDPDGLRDLTFNMKDILKGLRELKKSTPLAFEMLKVFSEGNESSVQDMWNHKELVQVDCSVNGEVLSVVCFKDRIFSGHSDGTIKVWTGKGSILHLIQETREHAKAVTSLAILQSGEKLYSGSLDRTVRVWSISNEVMHCTEVHDMKDQVHTMVVANSISCFIPQGAGVKVQSWNGNSKLLNQNKHVKCLALAQGKLYCGCHDNSIQEIDLASGTLSTIQSGSRKLLTKAYPIHALQVYNGFIYSASSSLDGIPVKIWNASNHSIVGSLPSTSEVRTMTVSSELIYLGCKGGMVEIWSRDKQNKVETLQTGTNSKVLCMTLDNDEEYLVIGTSDGQIRAWGLS